MTSRNDPRLDVYAWDAFGTGYAYAPAGDSELAKSTNTVGLPVWLENGAAPLHLFSLAELHFIIAECKARTGADASGNLAAAVQASFDDYAAATEEALGDASAYVAALGAPTLAEVMVQKYLAQTRDEQVQTYNDLRRCKAQGEEFVKLLNPNNSQGGQNRVAAAPALRQQRCGFKSQRDRRFRHGQRRRQLYLHRERMAVWRKPLSIIQTDINKIAARTIRTAIFISEQTEFLYFTAILRAVAPALTT